MPRASFRSIETRRGRVVYDRKVHLFSDKDVRRILSKVDLSSPSVENPLAFLDFLGSKMLEALMGPLSNLFDAQQAYAWLRAFVLRALSEALDPRSALPASIKEEAASKYDQWISLH